MNREHWSSPLAFVLATVGSAIGLGNIWRFSYIVGQNGGGAFLIPYILSVIFIGLPVMLLEIGIGRHYKGGVISSLGKVKGYKHLYLLGFIPVIIGIAILSYYAVIMGWTLAYAVFAMLGITMTFTEFVNGYLPLLFLVIVMVAVLLILNKGIKKGIEKTCMVLMPLLFIFLFMLVGKSLTLPNAIEGVRYYLTPDFTVLSDLKIWISAVGQALFSLSAGSAILITYGSYLTRKEDIVLSSVYVAVGDTLFALLSGLAIFPMIFAFGLDPAAGPELAFVTLPKAFALLPFGNLFAAIFFLALFFGALTSAISILEVIVTAFVDQFKWERKKVIFSSGLFTILLGVPSALCYKFVGLEVLNQPFLDFMDNFFGTLLLPFSAIVIIIGFVLLNGKVKLLQEVNKGSKVKLGKSMFYLWKYLIPLVLGILFFYFLNTLF